MEDLEVGGLKIEVDAARTDALQLTWRGRSVDQQPAVALKPYLGRVVEAALTRKVPLEVHFEHLEHVNSSTLSVVIRLVQNARQRGVRLTFVYNPASKWQKLSFDALRVFENGDQLFSLRAL
jgi:hypothetical protein